MDHNPKKEFGVLRTPRRWSIQLGSAINLPERTADSEVPRDVRALQQSGRPCPLRDNNGGGQTRFHHAPGRAEGVRWVRRLIVRLDSITSMFDGLRRSLVSTAAMRLHLANFRVLVELPRAKDLSLPMGCYSLEVFACDGSVAAEELLDVDDECGEQTEEQSEADDDDISDRLAQGRCASEVRVLANVCTIVEAPRDGALEGDAHALTHLIVHGCSCLR